MPRRRPSRPSHVTPARSTALAVLTQVRERDAFVRDLLDRALSDARLPAEERGFASVLAYGVVSTYGTLDEELDRFLDRPGQVAPAARDALRISAYELLFLRKPAHSAVDQGVELVRSVARARWRMRRPTSPTAIPRGTSPPSRAPRGFPDGWPGASTRTWAMTAPPA